MELLPKHLMPHLGREKGAFAQSTELDARRHVQRSPCTLPCTCTMPQWSRVGTSKTFHFAHSFDVFWCHRSHRDAGRKKRWFFSPVVKWMYVMVQGETGKGLYGFNVRYENRESTSGSPTSGKHSVVSHETHPVKSAVMVSTQPVARRSACDGKSGAWCHIILLSHCHPTVCVHNHTDS